MAPNPESVPGDSGTASIDPLAGTRYRTLEHIGAGGMGEVFLVEHTEIGRRFVAKLLRADRATDAKLVDRMRIEAAALGRLQHPGIVDVSNFGIAADGRPFFVMERLIGCTLREELRARGFLEVGEAIRWVRQVLSALGAAHAVGIVHRDIKPQNLFLHEEPSGRRVVKVLDFGIAKILESAQHGVPKPLVPTEEGMMLGTPRYTSPEAALGRPVDARSDLYSVGLVLYALVRGSGPWDRIAKDVDILVAQARTAPEPPSQGAPQPIGAELEGVIMKALAKRPEDRFQSAAEFDAALAECEAMIEAPTGWSPTTSFDVVAAARGLANVPEVWTGFETDRDGSPKGSPRSVTPKLAPSSVAFEPTERAPSTASPQKPHAPTEKLGPAARNVLANLPTRTAPNPQLGAADHHDSGLRTNPSSDGSAERSTGRARTLLVPLAFALLAAVGVAVLTWWLLAVSTR